VAEDDWRVLDEGWNFFRASRGILCRARVAPVCIRGRACSFFGSFTAGL